jgi:hypothetical protein
VASGCKLAVHWGLTAELHHRHQAWSVEWDDTEALPPPHHHVLRSQRPTTAYTTDVQLTSLPLSAGSTPGDWTQPAEGSWFAELKGELVSISSKCASGPSAQPSI